MPGSWPPHELPNAKDDNCFERSQKKNRYNCIAWAAGNNTQWWWPLPLAGGSNYWPPGVPRRETMDAFIRLYEALGFVLCTDGSLEPGIEKVALFAVEVGTELKPTHAARQLESGQWTSKVGPFEDVDHTTLDV